MGNFTNMSNFTIDMGNFTILLHQIGTLLGRETGSRRPPQLGPKGPAEVAFVAIAIPLKYSQFEGI